MLKPQTSLRYMKIFTFHDTSNLQSVMKYSCVISSMASSMWLVQERPATIKQFLQWKHMQAVRLLSVNSVGPASNKQFRINNNNSNKEQFCTSQRTWRSYGASLDINQLVTYKYNGDQSCKVRVSFRLALGGYESACKTSVTLLKFASDELTIIRIDAADVPNQNRTWS